MKKLKLNNKIKLINNINESKIRLCKKSKKIKLKFYCINFNLKYNSLFCVNYKQIFNCFNYFKINEKCNNKIFFLKIKKHKNLLLLNIFLNKRKLMFPTVTEIKKKNNRKISLKFVNYFIKNYFLYKNNYDFEILFRIKNSKIQKDKNSRRRCKRKFYFINKKAFIFFKFIRVLFLIVLKVDLKIGSLYNSSHALENLKYKKIRRI